MSIYAYQLLKVMGLSEQRLLRVLPKIEVQSLAPDHVIFKAGARPDAFAHVMSGLVAIGVAGSGGAMEPLHIAGPGTWLGVDAILNPGAVGLEIICLSPVRLLVVPLADAQDAFDNELRVAQYLAHLTSWRKQLLTEKLALLRQASPQLRVVMGLALSAEALCRGSSHLPSTGLGDFQEIPLKQALLASLCGVSRGKFSESVQQLAAAGWLRLNYATLTLTQAGAWHRFGQNYRSQRQVNHELTMPQILSLLDEAAAS